MGSPIDYGYINCLNDKSQQLLDLSKQTLPIYVYHAIQTAFDNQHHMFKSIALTHIANCWKKGILTEDQFQEFLSLLDSFPDSYEIFVGAISNRTWDDIKINILGGI